MTLQEYNDIFKDSPTKQLHITTSSELEIENDNILSESMSLEESLYSEQKMRFGSCEASCFKISIADINHDFTGEWLTIEMSVDGISSPLTIGKYKVFSDKPTNDRKWRELTCYDAMYDILNANVKTWFDNLTFPISISDLRNSLFTELGITQVNTTLVNDDFMTNGEFYVDGSVSAKDILVAICELNGVFGHINSDGQFEYIDLTNAETLTYDWYIDGTGSYEDYVTDTITGIIARASDEDVGTTVGTTTNPYVIQNNPLVFGSEGTTELQTALTNLLTKISTISFRPFGVETYGNPMLPLGTQITLNTRDKTIVSYVLRKYMTGIQGLKDNLSASATQKQENYVNSIQSKITRTGGKIHKVVSEVDRLESEIVDFEQDVSSSITQMSNEIVLKVQNDGSLALVQLGADASTGETSFVVKAGNFSVDVDGNVTITGDITAKSKLILRGTYIDYSGVAHYEYMDVLTLSYETDSIFNRLVEYIDIKDGLDYSYVTFSRLGNLHPGQGNQITVNSPTTFLAAITPEKGLFTRDGRVSWIKGRDGAGIVNTAYNGNGSFYPITSVKSANGSWEMGTLSGSDNLYFSFALDTNYNNNTNQTGRYFIEKHSNNGDYRIAHSGNVGTGDSNGQVKIAGTNVSVKGLGSRAYDSTAYVPASGGTFTGAVQVKGNDKMFVAMNDSGGNVIRFGVGGAGTNRGIWDNTLNKWLFYTDGSKVYVNSIKVGTAVGAWFNSIPIIGNDGLMEIGRYIDFHQTTAHTGDYTFRFDNNGSNTLKASGTISQGSSRKIKENIKDMTEEEALKILELNPVSFDYKKEFGGGKDNRGFIAEDVEKILPNLITPEEGDIEDIKHFSPMSLNYTGIIPYLTKLCQIQQDRIDSLEERISNLEKLINNL